MPRNPEVTQQRLIDATAEIMASVGIAGLRVDQIAQRTGVNKRMIYHYFSLDCGVFNFNTVSSD